MKTAFKFMMCLQKEVKLAVQPLRQKFILFKKIQMTRVFEMVF